MPRSEAVQKKPADQVTKTPPVRSRRRDLDTHDQQVGQNHTRHMKSRGPAREALEPTKVQAVERVVSKDKLEALAFNEEVLTIVVHESTNPLDEPYPEVWNDGIRQMFKRGSEMQVKRKFVEVLARAKKTVYRNEEYRDGNGDKAIRHPGQTALRYPFEVRHDPSGDKGRAWLKNVLMEA